MISKGPQRPVSILAPISRIDRGSGVPSIFTGAAILVRTDEKSSDRTSGHGVLLL